MKLIDFQPQKKLEMISIVNPLRKLSFYIFGRRGRSLGCSFAMLWVGLLWYCIFHIGHYVLSGWFVFIFLAVGFILWEFLAYYPEDLELLAIDRDNNHFLIKAISPSTNKKITIECAVEDVEKMELSVHFKNESQEFSILFFISNQEIECFYFLFEDIKSRKNAMDLAKKIANVLGIEFGNIEINEPSKLIMVFSRSFEDSQKLSAPIHTYESAQDPNLQKAIIEEWDPKKHNISSMIDVGYQPKKSLSYKNERFTFRYSSLLFFPLFPLLVFLMSKFFGLTSFPFMLYIMSFIMSMVAYIFTSNKVQYAFYKFDFVNKKLEWEYRGKKGKVYEWEHHSKKGVLDLQNIEVEITRSSDSSGIDETTTTYHSDITLKGATLGEGLSIRHSDVEEEVQNVEEEVQNVGLIFANMISRSLDVPLVKNDITLNDNGSIKPILEPILEKKSTFKWKRFLAAIIVNVFLLTILFSYFSVINVYNEMGMLGKTEVIDGDIYQTVNFSTELFIIIGLIFTWLLMRSMSFKKKKKGTSETFIAVLIFVFFFTSISNIIVLFAVYDHKIDKIKKAAEKNWTRYTNSGQKLKLQNMYTHGKVIIMENKQFSQLNFFLPRKLRPSVANEVGSVVKIVWVQKNKNFNRWHAELQLVNFATNVTIGKKTFGGFIKKHGKIIVEEKKAIIFFLRDLPRKK